MLPKLRQDSDVHRQILTNDGCEVLFTFSPQNLADTAVDLMPEEDVSDHNSPIEKLVPALKWLDDLLEIAFTAAEISFGVKADADPYRGLYISPQEMERLFSQHAGAGAWQIPSSGTSMNPVEQDSPIFWLRDAYGLSEFDLKIVLLALAPEIDLKYERIYAYLQDDVTRRRPSIDLALNLFSSTVDEKWIRRLRFAPDAPLVKNGLIHLVPDSNQIHPPLLAHTIKLDEQIVRYLIGSDALDARLVSFCEISKYSESLDELASSNEATRTLPLLVSHAMDNQEPLRLYFQGQPGIGKRRTAEVLARTLEVSLLMVDIDACLASGVDFQQALRIIFRHAWLDGSFLYLDGVDVLLKEGREPQLRKLLAALAEYPGIAILAGKNPLDVQSNEPVGILSIEFPNPQYIERLALWSSILMANDIRLPTDEIEALASRFSLTPTQISETVSIAMKTTLWNAAIQPGKQEVDYAQLRPRLQDLLAAARRQCGQSLASLALKIDPVYQWNDIVLPSDATTQLREIKQRVAHRHRVLYDWGFAKKMSSGKGITALFTGSSGTGKTMAAEVIANDLGLDLYKIDLSGIVSKYIGETEKNLDKIFTTAKNANAILFFDEADALFGKRSKVRDSHDRYANIEISYLLQKMEEYDGVTILATNLRQNMDEAFVRRMTFTVHFPFPDSDARLQIWHGVWPAEMPLSKNVNLDLLAQEYKLAGGNIKNIALASAFFAAEDGGEVTMSHLMHATRREYQKLGKVLPETQVEIMKT